MFESLPTYPDAGRYWDLVERHQINSFYTAPTAIRALMKFGNEPVRKYNKSSLRVLGSVGEPINPEAWRWYFDEVGEKRCVVVDTFWQTETGGHMVTNLPGVTPMKPGAASLPMFGVRTAVVDPKDGATLEGNEVDGVLCVSQPWPGIARSIFGDHERYMNTYLRPYAGKYFTGDGCRRDKDGYIWITGRVDDVLNVSGHRLGTAEIESALVTHEACVEAAVIGIPHDVKGQGVFAYVILKEGASASADTVPGLKQACLPRRGGACARDANARGFALCAGGAQRDRRSRDPRVRRVRSRPAKDPLGQDHAPGAAQDRGARGGSGARCVCARTPRGDAHDRDLVRSVRTSPTRALHLAARRYLDARRPVNRPRAHQARRGGVCRQEEVSAVGGATAHLYRGVQASMMKAG